MVTQYNALASPLSPKAQARADQAAIEKRRRELLDEKQTMDARKEDQVLANVRRQGYQAIDQMQFAPQNPIKYKNTVPAVELSQAPIQPGTEKAVGGPETPTPRWAQAPQVSDQPTGQGQPKWMQAPAVANVEPLGGTGEFDPKAFSGLNVIQNKPLHDGNDAINAGIEEAAAQVPGGYANFQKQSPDPARMQAMGYVRDPLAKGGYAKPRVPDAFETTQNNPSENNLLTDISRAASAPFQQNENVRSAAGVPIAFGHGLGQGWQALANNTMAVGTDAVNSVRGYVDPNATPFERPRVSLFDRNALLDEGGLLQSDTNAIPQAMGQYAALRGPIGKASKGGAFGHMAAKDAAAIALSTDHTAPRLSDMISSNTPVLGPIADLLRSNENDPAIVSMMKNLGEDLSISALTAGILGLVDKSLSVVRPGAANSGTDPRLDPAVAAQIKRVLAKEPVDTAMPTNALASPKPFSASAVPAAGNIVRRNADRIVTGGIGATIGGAADAFAAPGDGGGDGEGGPPIGAGIGAGIGIFGPRAVASAASRGFRAAARPFRPVGFDERVAARAVRNALKSGGITTPEQAAAAMTARFGEKPASIADLTQDGVGTAAGLSRLPGATGEAARARGEDLLQNRAGRLEGDIAQANPSLNPAAIAGDVDRMVQLAQAQAKPAYDGLRARYPLGSIVSDRLEQLRGLDILAPHLRGVDRYRETLAATEGRVVGDFEYWDLVKRSLDDTEQAAVARNQPVPYDLDSTRQAIVQEMDRLVPDYPAARELGGEAPKMRDAFKQGQALLGGRYTAEDVSRLIQGITGQQLTAAQAGVIRSMVAKTEGARGAMASLMSTGARRKLAQVFGPDAADAMQARFAADAAIVNNAQRINPNVGSVTSQAQLGGGIGPMVADAIRAVRSPAEAALAALSRSGSYSKAQRDLMGQMLLDGVTPENLERIFRSRTPRGPRTAPGGPAAPPTGGGAGPAGGAPRPRGPRSAPSEESVLSAMSQVNQLAAGRPAPRGPMGPPVREALWNGPVPSKPQSLLAWIRSQGGINDTNYMTGDLTAIMGRANGMPGLLNRKSGQGLDDLAAAAYHQGFDVNPDDANSLVRLIEEEFGGNPNYRLGAKEEWDAYQETLRARRGAPGETSNASPAVTGALIGGTAGYVASDGDPTATLAGAGLGGVAVNRLAKFGSSPKAPPRAPVAMEQSGKPAPKPVQNGFGSSKLPMDEGARMARRKAWQAEKGPVDDRVVYHGSLDSFDEFNPKKSGSGAYHFSDDEKFAEQYASTKSQDAQLDKSPIVKPYYIRGNIFDASNPQHMAALEAVLPDELTWTSNYGWSAFSPGFKRSKGEVLKNVRGIDKPHSPLTPELYDMAKPGERLPKNLDGSVVVVTDKGDGWIEYLDEYVARRNREITRLEELRAKRAKDEPLNDLERDEYRMLLDMRGTREIRKPKRVYLDPEETGGFDTWGLLESREIRPFLKQAGFDGAIATEGKSKTYIVFDRKNIRRTDAKFDPAESGSSKLLAGMADNASGKGALGGMALGGTFAPDANGDGVVDAQERANGALGGAFSGGIGGAVAGRALGAFGRGANKLAGGVERAGRAGGIDANGIKAFHGSPHDFDKFELSDKTIGTGEGAQAYGHGLYFAENDAVAKGYRDATSLNKGFSLNGKDKLTRDQVLSEIEQQHGVTPDGKVRYFDNVTNAKGVADRVMDDMIYGRVKPYPEGSERAALYDDLAEQIKQTDKGRLYEVDINSAPDDLLDWDKPLSQQSEAVRRKLADTIRLQKVPLKNNMGDETTVGQMIGYLENRFGNKADVLYELKGVGIPGIKYLDQGSRSGGKGTSNYVVFDDSAVSIVNKQGFFGSGKAESRPKPPPANRLSGGQKPKREGPSTASRMVAGGVIGGIAGSAGSADPQTAETAQKIADNKAQLDGLRADIAKLEADKAFFRDAETMDIQMRLQREGKNLGNTGPNRDGVDGINKGLTRQGINDFKAQIEADLERAYKRRTDLEKVGTDLDEQAAFEAEEAPEWKKVGRELAPWIGLAAGMALGYRGRSGAVKKAIVPAQKAATTANKLLTPGPVSPGRTNASRAALKRQYANINEFWTLGGAGDRVPFEVKANGDYKPRAKKDVMPPSELFKNQRFRAGDKVVMAMAAGETGLSTVAIHFAEGELKAAQEAVDDQATPANVKRLETARDNLALLQLAQRAGAAMLATRVAGSFKKPYPSVRETIPGVKAKGSKVVGSDVPGADVAGADSERALLLEYLQK